MQSTTSIFTSFVQQQAEFASPPSSGKRYRPFAETENSSPLKSLRPSPESAVSKTQMGPFRDEANPDEVSPKRLLGVNHPAHMHPEYGFTQDEPMEEIDCMLVTVATNHPISQSDWLLVQTLNQNVFSLLTQVANARMNDPLMILDQQMAIRYPGISLVEHGHFTGSAIHLNGNEIRVRQDFMTRITTFSDEPSVLIARALLTDCIICKLCELYQNGQIHVAELTNMNAGCQAHFLENRKAMLRAYQNTEALPMPDQFSTLCVLDYIPL